VALPALAIATTGSYTVPGKGDVDYEGAYAFDGWESERDSSAPLQWASGIPAGQLTYKPSLPATSSLAAVPSTVASPIGYSAVFSDRVRFSWDASVVKATDPAGITGPLSYYVAEGKSLASDEDVALTSLPKLTGIPGYSFMGWGLASDPATVISTATILASPVSAPVDYVAVWSVDTLTFTGSDAVLALKCTPQDVAGAYEVGAYSDLEVSTTATSGYTASLKVLGANTLAGSGAQSVPGLTQDGGLKVGYWAYLLQDAPPSTALPNSWWAPSTTVGSHSLTHAGAVSGRTLRLWAGTQAGTGISPGVYGRSIEVSVTIAA
jgi:hypothetical protein